MKNRSAFYYLLAFGVGIVGLAFAVSLHFGEKLKILEAPERVATVISKRTEPIQVPCHEGVCSRIRYLVTANVESAGRDFHVEMSVSAYAWSALHQNQPFILDTEEKKIITEAVLDYPIGPMKTSQRVFWGTFAIAAILVLVAKRSYGSSRETQPNQV